MNQASQVKSNAEAKITVKVEEKTSGEVTGEEESLVEAVPLPVSNEEHAARTTIAYERTVSLGNYNFVKVMVSCDWPHKPTVEEHDKAVKTMSEKLGEYMKTTVEKFTKKNEVHKERAY